MFRTRDFSTRAGMRLSSASRCLSAASAAGIIEKAARGLWQRCDSEPPEVECVGSHPFAPAWMNANEFLLDTVSGAAPRRISHMTALEAAGVPLVIGQQISFPHEHADSALLLRINVFREPSEHIPAFATRLTERTWMSSATRAAIEIAQHDVASPLWDERIAWAFVEDHGRVFDIEEAAEISDSLRMRAGLRRLSSIAHALCEFSTGDHCDMRNSATEAWAKTVTAKRGDAWIRLHRNMPIPLEPSSAAWLDSERKVMWDMSPESLVASLMT